ncbi:MAG: lactoylglutathione lyase [Thermoplasmata archaeon]|jgi:catechol 2,3-dioxygenase-like lactoylglutathione lyase family enzyme|nr:lactoylglutathione lyase [Thermoplasmata archaeon]
MMALADVGIAVSNAKVSAQWWKDKVGFEVFVLGGSGHAVMIAPPGDRFVLHLCEGFERPDPGNTGVAFITDDIKGQVARMEKGGVTFSQPMKKHAWGRNAKFLDPDGNEFWLLEAPAKMIRETKANKAKPGGRKAAKKAPKKARARSR